MKQVYIGTWALGWRNVDLYGRQERGGMSEPLPSRTGNGRIEICIAWDRWCDVLNLLLHETWEFLLNEQGTAFRPIRDCSGDANNRIFVFHHHEFSEVIAHQADFMAACYDATKAAWRTFTTPAKPQPNPKRKARPK